MTSDESDVLPADVLGERRHLMSLAFRMLGTVAEAEDAVQETYIRWYRLSQAERDAAVRNGDLAGLITVLDPQVVVYSDGGGVVSAARNPVFGAEKVARFTLGLVSKNPHAAILEQETPDGLGFAIWDEGTVIGVVTLEVAEGLVSDVRMMMNPGKLTLWN